MKGSDVVAWFGGLVVYRLVRWSGHASTRRI